jgi:E3 ubiquitin-protein ligase RAD18
MAKLPVASIPMHIERGCPPPKPKSAASGTGTQKSDWAKVFSGAGSSSKKESAISKYHNVKLITELS